MIKISDEELSYTTSQERSRNQQDKNFREDLNIAQGERGRMSKTLSIL